MSSLLSGYEYDVFISYRQNDNQDGWVTQFVENLQRELKSIFKAEISVYFDSDPHHGLSETHDVDGSLKEKVKCLVFIPIVSQTYCDSNAFAWQKEFLAFLDFAKQDGRGLDITLSGGNVAKRVLPVRIHEIEEIDKTLFENEIGGVMRPVDFIYQESGVNRPLKIADSRQDNLNKTDYSNQVNKVANAIKQLVNTLREEKPKSSSAAEDILQTGGKSENWWEVAKERNVPRAAIAYIVTAWLLMQILDISNRFIEIQKWIFFTVTGILLLGFPVAIFLAWRFERSPDGFIRTQSQAALDNPYRPGQKKPFSGNAIIISVLLVILAISIGAKYLPGNITDNKEVSIAIIPFRNYTNKEDLGNFGIGLANEIRTQLSLSKQFSNISSEQSSLRFLDSDDDPVEIGQKLGVAYLIMGNFQLSGEKIKVSMEMVNANTGKTALQFPAFFTTFKNYSDLFNIQNEIAVKVMDKFSFKTNEETKAPTSSLQAFSDYSKGRSYSSKGWYFDDDIFKAIEYYEKAIREDSTYLSAWIALVDVKLKYLWAIAQNYYKQKRMDINLVSIESDLKYIEEHFENSWEINYIKGVYYYNGLVNYDKGLEYFLAAAHENPQNTAINSNISAIYRRKMELEKSLDYRLRTIEQDPLDPQNWYELSYIFWVNGDDEDQKQAIYKAWELDGDNPEAFNRLYNVYRSTNTLKELPQKIINYYKARYYLDVYWMERKMDSVLYVADTVKDELMSLENKVKVYWYLDQTDSAKYYAKKLVEKFPDDGNLLALLITGDMDGYRTMFNDADKLIAGGDNSLKVFKAFRETYLAYSLGDYQKATQIIVDYYEKYPEDGRTWFLDDPNFDRIKKEYPPFLDAVNNLKKPQPLGKPDRSKM